MCLSLSQAQSPPRHRGHGHVHVPWTPWHGLPRGRGLGGSPPSDPWEMPPFSEQQPGAWPAPPAGPRPPGSRPLIGPGSGDVTGLADRTRAPGAREVLSVPPGFVESSPAYLAVGASWPLQPGAGCQPPPPPPWCPRSLW